MVPSLVFAALVSVMQTGPAPVVLVSRSPNHDSAARADSMRALKSARRAQANFESIRRMNLPRESGVGSHHCDVHIGRWCIWNDESNDREPPPESPTIRRARERLLGVLDTLGAAFPGDEWIASQQVRYLLEAGRHADAIRVADRCTASGSRYLCGALAALAYHDSGAVAAADSAFTRTLGAMPDSVRCQWSDISQLLDDDVASRYDHADCAGRESIASTFWRLTNPLYLRANDWRDEFLARVTRSEMERDSRTPSGSPDEPAFRETALRYGYDTWFVRDDGPMGSMQDAAIAGYRAGGAGYNFVPDPAVFNAPANLRQDDWDLKLRSARTNYAPAYARHFRALHRKQIAIFRRGDSALVVAAYDVSDDTLFARGRIEAGLFAAPVDSMTIGEVRGAIQSESGMSGVLMAHAAWSPMVVSLEILNDSSRSAARARYGLRPPTGEGRIQLSDLLLFSPRPSDSISHRLETVLPLALQTDRVNGRDLLGVFWETYGVRPEGESFPVTITIERIREGLMRRTAERLHLASPFSPVKVQWREVPDGKNGIASRAVNLDLSQLGSGLYAISVTLTPADGAPVVSTRELRIER